MRFRDYNCCHIWTKENEELKVYNIGNLVMAWVQDIKNPALKAGLIHPHYVMVKKVYGFRKRKWAKGEVNDNEYWSVQWMTVYVGNKKYHDVKDHDPIFTYDDYGHVHFFGL